MAIIIFATIVVVILIVILLWLTATPEITEDCDIATTVAIVAPQSASYPSDRLAQPLSR